jgi:hypothetical protein
MQSMSEGTAKADIVGSGSGSGIPEIHAQESHRRYKLIDLDNSEIERTAAEICEGSKLLSNKGLWVANFRATVEKVRDWCEGNRAGIRMALVNVRSNKVLFYFVPESDRYDLSLGGKMTALEVELGSAGIGYVETLQVPDRSLEGFVGTQAMLIWKRDANS